MDTTSTTSLKPFFNPAPSDFIEEELEVRGWTQEDLADILGYTPQTISKLLNGKSSITPSVALALGKAFDQTPQFWLNLEALYQLNRCTNEQTEAQVAHRRQIYEVMPINEMHKKGWITKPKLYHELVDVISVFWRDTTVNWLNGIKNTSNFSNNRIVFRKSETHESKFDQNAAKCWFQMAKNVSEQINVPIYNPERLEKLLVELPQYTISLTGIADALEELTQCGVVFFVLSHLKQTYIDGAAFIHNNKRVIVYTGRYKRLDNFWFTLAHEIVHQLRHINEGNMWIIDVEKAEITQQEQEANSIASAALRQPEVLRLLGGITHYLKSTQITAAAKQVGIHPCLVVGAMAFQSDIHFRRLNEFNADPMLDIPNFYHAEKNPQ